MTEADKTQKDTTAVSDTTSGKRCGKKGWVCLVVLLLVFGAGLGAARCPWVMRYYVPQHDTHLTAMQVEIEALTQRVDALEKKADQATVAVTQPAPQATDNTAKVDVQALNARLDQLQKDVQQASVLATQSRDATHGQIAIAMAAMEFRTAVDSGRSFARELALLQALAKDDLAIQSDLAKLQNVSTEGVPTCTALLDRLRKRESAATIVDEKPATEADQWQGLWQKIKAEARHFVVIRPANAPTDKVFAGLERALERGDAATAVTEYGNLPDGVSKVLRDWSLQVTVRRDTDDAVRDILAHAAMTAGGAR